MRIAAVVKPVAPLDAASPELEGGGLAPSRALTLNPFCLRAVAQACELAAAVGDGTVTVLCLGPPSAADTLRDTLTWARATAVACDAVLLSDPAFEGSDTLATARTLAAAIEAAGGYDLVLTGRSAVDVDTGQVGPQLAELLGLPFAAGARFLSLRRDTLRIRCEHDDGWVQLDVELPAVVSCAERLIDPGQSSPSASRPTLRTVDAAALGPGPWGQTASAVRVEAVAHRIVLRRRTRLEGPVHAQVGQAVEALRECGALDAGPTTDGQEAVPPAQGERGEAVGVVVEPTRIQTSRQLLATAAQLAVALDWHAVALTVEAPDAETLGSWGADAVVQLEGSALAEDVGGALAEWVRVTSPRVVLGPSTMWGREVVARAAARLDAGLIGGATDVTIDSTGRLRVHQPVLGGQQLAVLTTTSAVQLVTVRPGALATHAARASGRVETRSMGVDARSRVRIRSEVRDDDLEALANAPVVVGVGLGVPRSSYPALGPLLAALGAQLGATRPVVDRGWLPHARQIGLTGRAIAPRLYVAIGVAGRPAHMVGVSGAETVLAIHDVPDAPVFDGADLGIVADWRDVVPRLAAALGAEAAQA
jgi:electron transfer flavoprotein alpha subunit